MLSAETVCCSIFQLFCFETGSEYISQLILRLTVILLPQHHEDRDYRYGLLNLVLNLPLTSWDSLSQGLISFLKRKWSSTCIRYLTSITPLEMSVHWGSRMTFSLRLTQWAPGSLDFTLRLNKYQAYSALRHLSETCHQLTLREREK